MQKRTPSTSSPYFSYRKRAERKAVVKAAGWRSSRISPTQMDRVGRASTPTRSTILACTFPAGSAPSCPKQHWGLKRSHGTPTLTPAPGEVCCRRATSTHPFRAEARVHQGLPKLQKNIICYFSNRDVVCIGVLSAAVKSVHRFKDKTSTPTC